MRFLHDGVQRDDCHRVGHHQGDEENPEYGVPSRETEAAKSVRRQYAEKDLNRGQCRRYEKGVPGLVLKLDGKASFSGCDQQRYADTRTWTSGRAKNSGRSSVPMPGEDGGVIRPRSMTGRPETISLYQSV